MYSNEFYCKENGMKVMTRTWFGPSGHIRILNTKEKTTKNGQENVKKNEFQIEIRGRTTGTHQEYPKPLDFEFCMY